MVNWDSWVIKFSSIVQANNQASKHRLAQTTVYFT